MAKRDALGATGLDALDTFLSDKTSEPVVATTSTTIETHDEAVSLEKPRFTVRISAELQDRVRDAVYWDRDTVTAFTERAFQAELERREMDRGEAYPPRSAELKAGRPIR